MTTPEHSMIAKQRGSLPPPWRSVPWWLLVVAVLCQSLLARGGTFAAALFMGSTLLYVAAVPRWAVKAALTSVVPWLYPGLAAASILWSDAATTSLRLSVELCLSTIGMLAIGRRLSSRDLISGLLLALLLAGLASFAMGSKASLISANLPLTGIYASKNLLAFHMVLLLLCAVATLLDRTQPQLARLAAIPGILLGLVLTRGAQSAGASVMGGMALLVLLGVVFVGSMPRRLHARILACAVIMLACGGALAVTSGHELAEMFFTATGKDAGLTGRTFLWQRAVQLFGERPALGYGYQAFWRHDYPEAEALWHYFKIADRAGFNFHDLYYEVAVELGLVGLAVIVVTLAIYGARTLRHAVQAPGPQTGLLLALCVLLLARSGIEVDLGYPLGTATVLFPILLARRAPPRPRPVNAWPALPEARQADRFFGSIASDSSPMQGHVAGLR